MTQLPHVKDPSCNELLGTDKYCMCHSHCDLFLARHSRNAMLLCGLEEVEQVAVAGDAESDTPSPADRRTRAGKRRTNRGALPAHLPRAETAVDITDRTCPCCAGALHVIGEDVAERLDIVPRSCACSSSGGPKYACRSLC